MSFYFCKKMRFSLKQYCITMVFVLIWNHALRNRNRHENDFTFLIFFLYAFNNGRFDDENFWKYHIFSVFWWHPKTMLHSLLGTSTIKRKTFSILEDFQNPLTQLTRNRCFFIIILLFWKVWGPQANPKKWFPGDGGC